MGVHKGIFALGLLGILWLAGKFLLPFVFPFLLGTGLALASEPAVRFSQRRLHLKRGPAAGLGVSLTLVLLSGIILFLGALVVRELGAFARRVPEMVRQSAGVMEEFLAGLSQKAPASVAPVLTDAVHRFFQDSSLLTDQAVRKVPGLLTSLLGKVSGKAVTLGTGVLSGYFICARLPELKDRLRNGLPAWVTRHGLPTLQHLRSALGKWLTAQGKLIAITYGIVTLGLLLLRIPYAPAWALLVAAVDAVPLLGTGTVLLPWALTRLLQGEPGVGAAMVGIYLAAMITRTALEPRLYGRHLGLDPLVTLFFLYFGYRLWGFWGIVISPLLAATTQALADR